MEAASGLADHPGEWVAIDGRSNTVIAANRDFEALLQQLKEQKLFGMFIQRAPEPGDPIFIGLG